MTAFLSINLAHSTCSAAHCRLALVARIAGNAIGADEFLPNMGSEDFLLCLSRQALEASCAEASVQPRQKVRETRAALVEHFASEHFVHPASRFAPPADELLGWIHAGAANDVIDTGFQDDEDGGAGDPGADHEAQLNGDTDQKDLRDTEGAAGEEDQDQAFDQRAAA